MLLSRPIVTAVLFLVSLGAIIFLIVPAYERFRIISSDLANVRKEYQYVSEYYATLQGLQDQLHQYESVLVKIDAALPSRLSLPALFAHLQTMSAQNGLVLAKFGTPVIQVSGTNPSVKELKLDLALTGSYDSLKNLLGALYRNAKLIDVDSISFSAPQEEGLFDFQVVIKTYSY